MIFLNLIYESCDGYVDDPIVGYSVTQSWLDCSYVLLERYVICDKVRVKYWYVFWWTCVPYLIPIECKCEILGLVC